MPDATTVTLFSLILLPLLLVAAIGSHRALITFTTDKAANTFSPSGEDVSAFATRLARVHANCYEFLPFALAALLYAVATETTHITNGLAFYFLGARLAQASVHLLSASQVAVSVRFAFFLLQWGILGYWSLTFLAG
ncbi:MAG: MAPEG family protein [Gammaproteobacteria bacterium]|nr:MAPEG family protein [Gammaproteobacteria bacterium]